MWLTPGTFLSVVSNVLKANFIICLCVSKFETHGVCCYQIWKQVLDSFAKVETTLRGASTRNMYDEKSGCVNVVAHGRCRLPFRALPTISSPEVQDETIKFGSSGMISRHFDDVNFFVYSSIQSEIFPKTFLLENDEARNLHGWSMASILPSRFIVF
jgi:hypothetical protein